MFHHPESSVFTALRISLALSPRVTLHNCELDTLEPFTIHTLSRRTPTSVEDISALRSAGQVLNPPEKTLLLTYRQQLAMPLGTGHLRWSSVRDLSVLLGDEFGFCSSGVAGSIGYTSLGFVVDVA